MFTNYHVVNSRGEIIATYGWLFQAQILAGNDKSYRVRNAETGRWVR